MHCEHDPVPAEYPVETFVESCREMIEGNVIIPPGEKGESKCTLVYGQMNEPPGARARVALTGLPPSRPLDASQLFNCTGCSGGSENAPTRLLFICCVACGYFMDNITVVKYHLPKNVEPLRHSTCGDIHFTDWNGECLMAKNKTPEYVSGMLFD